MNLAEAMDRAIRALRLEDAEFERLDDVRVRKLEEQIGPPPLTRETLPPPGEFQRFPEFIALGAPVRPNWDAPTVPVLVAHVAMGPRTWNVLLSQNTRLFVTRVATGEITTFRPFYDSPHRKEYVPSGGGEAPSYLDTAIEYGVRVADVKRFLPASWHGNALAVTATCYDQISNTVETRSSGSPLDEEPEAPAAPSSFVRPLSTRPLEDVQLDAPTSPVALKDLRFTCGFRLPKSAVRTAPPTSDSQARLSLVTLALVKLDDNRPVLLNAWVRASEAGDQVSGSFHLDAASASPDRPVQGKYMSYLIVGNRMIGPRPIDVLP